MHQTRKGKQWYFGMKAHVGVDSKTKIIHTAVATAANVADSAVLPDLLHGAETRVWGDQAYRGQTQVSRECAPQAQDCTHRRYRYKDRVDQVERAKNRTKSTVRSKVEHVFGVMKLKFGFVKLRYRGLKKNANQLFCGVRAGKSVLGAEKTVAAVTGLTRKRRLQLTSDPPNRRKTGKNRIRTLAAAWQNTYYLEDLGLFRVSLAYP
jgi:Transposase DDE domain